MSKKYFEWCEPEPVVWMRWAQRKAEWRWWHLPLVFFIFLSPGPIAGLLNNTDPSRPPVAVLFSIPFLGAIAGLGLNILERRSSCPTKNEVAISGRRVISNVRPLFFSKAASFAWEVQAGFATLTFTHTTNLGKTIIGVPLDVSREEVSQFLMSRGVPSLDAGQAPRPRIKPWSFRREISVCAVILAIVGAIACWASVMAGKVLIHFNGADAVYPTGVRLALSAHIWSPVFLLMVLGVAARIKRRKASSDWLAIAAVSFGALFLFFLGSTLKAEIVKTISAFEEREKLRRAALSPFKE